AARLFRFAKLLNLCETMGKLSFTRIELFARMMGIEYAKVRVQCLVAPRLARLSLQRADLALYFLDNVTNTQKICLGRFHLAQSAKWTGTLAHATRFAASVPLKMTPATASPRSDFADCSPKTLRTASSAFDFPQPFGPTIAVMPS